MGGGGSEKLLREVAWEGSVHEDVEDMVFWTKTKSGKFSVKSLYYALEATTLIFFQVAFGMCGCSPRLASLLGRL